MRALKTLALAGRVGLASLGIGAAEAAAPAGMHRDALAASGAVQKVDYRYYRGGGYYGRPYWGGYYRPFYRPYYYPPVYYGRPYYYPPYYYAPPAYYYPY
ncbi:MAG: hypothetical protein IT562_00165 [Alphaproteobacteria bacterium]|nr:hypothetical protein [Alphaproteobacteria bacterium]